MNEISFAISIFVLCVCGVFKLVNYILVKCNKYVSAYLVFGVVDVFWGLLVLGLALWDILTPGGDLNGMLGTLLLIIFEPVVTVLLIGDIVVWKVSKKKAMQVPE